MISDPEDVVFQVKINTGISQLSHNVPLGQRLPPIVSLGMDEEASILLLRFAGNMVT